MKKSKDSKLDKIIDSLFKTDFRRFETLDLAFQKLISSLAGGLEIDRVGIWKIENDVLVCRCFFDKTKGGFISEESMPWASHPDYYQHIKEGNSVIASDALKNEHTHVFSETYLKPLGVGALMDLPMNLNGEFHGVFTCEHVGGKREWTESEFYNVRYVADLASITEAHFKLREAEASLEYERTLLKTIVDNIPINVFVKDKNSKRILSNKQDQKYIGVSNDHEVLGKTDFDLFPAKTAKYSLAQDKAIFETQKAILVVESTHEKPDGSTAKLLVSKIPLIENNEVTGLIGISLDVTEREKNLAKIRKSEEELRFITENTTDGVMVIEGTEGNLIYISANCEKILGFSTEEIKKLVKRDWFDLVHPSDKVETRESVLKAIQNKAPNLLIKHRALNGKGDYRWHESSWSIIYDKKGAPEKTIIAIRDITERAINEELIRKSEEELRFITENTSDGILVVKHGELSYYSESCEKIIGYTFDEMATICQSDHLALVHPEDKEESQRLIDQALKNRNSNLLRVHRSKHKDGHYFWRENRVNYIYDNDGNLDTSILIIRDVSERIINEKLTRKNEERLRFITENTSDGILVTEKEGNLVYYSQSCEKITGFSFEEMAKLSHGKWIDYVHPEDTKVTLDKIRHTLRNKIAKLNTAYRTRHKDGHYVWQDNSVNIIYDKEGNVETTIVVLRDITERAENEALIRKSEEQFRFITENTSDGVMTIENELLTYYSPSCEKILGYTFDEMEDICRNDHMGLVHPDQQEMARMQVENAIKNRKTHYLMVHKSKHKDGHYIWRENSVSNIFDSEGNISNTILLMRDVTERINNEEFRLKNEEQLKFISENTSDGIFITEKGILTYYSPICEKILGYSFAEMHELSKGDFLDLVHPDDIKQTRERLVQAVKSNNKNVITVNRFRHKKGHYIWRENSVNIIYDNNGGVKSTLVVVRNINERMASEQKIKDSERNLNSILNSLDEVVWAISLPDNKPMFISNSFEEMYQVPTENWYREPDILSKGVVQEDKHLETQMNLDLEETGTTRCNLRIIDANGRIKWVSCFSKILKDEKGIPFMKLGVKQDISDKVRSEELARLAQKTATEATKAKAELELRTLQMQLNPHFIFNALNSIQSFVLRNDVISTNDYLSKFANLIRSILDSSRNVKISLNEEIRLLKLYVEMEQMRFEDKFEFEFNVWPEVDKTYEVPSMMLQPFVENAINHGIRYKKEKGKLKILFQMEKDVIVCHIEDNGVGREIARNILAKTNKGYVSQGMKITAERFETYNAIHGTKLSYHVEDLYPISKTEDRDVGTHIIIKFPPLPLVTE